MRDSFYVHEPLGNLRLWDSEKGRFAAPGRVLLQTGDDGALSSAISVDEVLSTVMASWT